MMSRKNIIMPERSASAIAMSKYIHFNEFN